MDHAPPPAQVTLERITAKRVELYHAVPLPGENIPMFVTLAHVYNSVSTEEEVEWVLQILRGHRS